MTFEESWAEVEKQKALPEMAIRQLPSSLSASTKKKLMKLKPGETVRILKAAIDIKTKKGLPFVLPQHKN